MTQCAAKSKRSGVQCKRAATPGMSVCAIHGGKSLVGPAHPGFKTGRYSRLLPVRLQASYAAARNDPELLALRDDIALTDARIVDLLGKLDTGESGAAWQAARSAADEVRQALLKQNAVALATALNALEGAIATGRANYAAWGEVGRALEHRRRLAESEVKRLIALRQVMTAEQAMTFATAIMDVVTRNVPDRAARAAIARDLGALLNRGLEEEGIVA